MAGKEAAEVHASIAPHSHTNASGNPLITAGGARKKAMQPFLGTRTASFTRKGKLRKKKRREPSLPRTSGVGPRRESGGLKLCPIVERR